MESENQLTKIPKSPFDKKEWSRQRYQERKAELAAQRADPAWRARRKAWAATHRALNLEAIRAEDRRRHHSGEKRRQPHTPSQKAAKSIMDKKWRIKNAAVKKELDRKYYAANKRRILSNIREYVARRVKVDADFKMMGVLRKRVYMAMKSQSAGRRAHKTMELIGCDLQTLRAHLESQFEPWMTWENHGRWTWVVDHIKPCASFNLLDPEQQKICFHYSNLRPLHWRENIVKGDKPLTQIAA